MLACCETARAFAHPGAEMTGLASALLAVGTSSVIAPLLPLPDEVAARLSHRWHTNLSGRLTPAEALSATMTDVAAEDPLPRLAAASLVCLGSG